MRYGPRTFEGGDGTVIRRVEYALPWDSGKMAIRGRAATARIFFEFRQRLCRGSGGDSSLYALSGVIGRVICTRWSRFCQSANS